MGPRGKNRNFKNVYGNVLWNLYFYANCNAHTQILRTVKDFAERFTFLPAFESNVPFLSALRSGLLTFFSSLVIQESLINFAGERRRSKTDSHCESVFVFCLSASHPRHSNSKKQKRRPLPVVSARLVPSPLRYSGPVIRF